MRQTIMSATDSEDVMILTHMSKVLRKLEDENYLIYTISNQGGISAGEVDCVIVSLYFNNRERTYFD